MLDIDLHVHLVISGDSNEKNTLYLHDLNWKNTETALPRDKNTVSLNVK